MQTEVSVRRLSPGDAFRVDMGCSGHLDYRMIYTTAGRAYVKPLGRREYQIKDADGAVLAEFGKPGDPVNISLETQVILLEKAMEDEEDLIGIGPATGGPAPAKTARVTKITSSKNGKTPAARLLKPCKPETKRGRLLALMVAGEQRFGVLEKKMEMKRNEIITYCSEMNRDYGIGYTVGDATVTIQLPAGCVSPFTMPEEEDLI